MRYKFDYADQQLAAGTMVDRAEQVSRGGTRGANDLEVTADRTMSNESPDGLHGYPRNESTDHVQASEDEDVNQMNYKFAGSRSGKKKSPKGVSSVAAVAASDVARSAQGQRSSKSGSRGNVGGAYL